MVFNLKDKQCHLSKEDVEKAMEGVEPLKGRHYFVVVNGRHYPVKQVLYVSLRGQVGGLSVLDFSNAFANSVLSQLGFEAIVER